MAGIGFELARYCDRETYRSDLTSYLGAICLFTGPWFFGAIAIFVVYIQSREVLQVQEQVLLFSMVTYSFAAAMILTSLLTFPITRFVADEIFSRRSDTVGPSFTGAWLLHLIVATLLGGLFYGLNPLPPVIRLYGIMLFVSCTLMWLSGAFITMLRSYLPVMFSFVGGYTLAIGASVFLGSRMGLAGYLLGLWLGISVVALGLSATILHRFPFSRPLSLAFLRNLPSTWGYLATGITLALGVWIDKFLFWGLAPERLFATPWIVTCPVYDVSFTIGLVSSIPGIAWLLLEVETRFAQDARNFYTRLAHHEPLVSLDRGMSDLTDGMNASFWGVLRIQAPISLILIFFARAIAEFLIVPIHWVPVIRMALLTAPMLVLIQAQCLYLLYFDQPWRAFRMTALHVILLVILTWASLHLGYRYYGLGALVASCTAVLIGGGLIDGSLKRLAYLTLTRFSRFAMEPAEE